MNSFRNVERAISLRDRAPGARGRAPASGSCRRPACGTSTGRRPGRCAARKTRTTTATSPSPTCCRWWSSRPGSTRCGRACPSCPAARRRRFEREHGLSAYDADVLTQRKDVADFFEAGRRGGRQPEGDGQLDHHRGAANRARGEAGRRPRHPRLAAHPGPAGRAGPSGGTRDASTATRRRACCPDCSAPAPTPKRLVAAEGLAQVSDRGALEHAVDDVLARHPDQVEQFRERQGAGHRLPRRAGDEEHRREGESAARAGAPARPRLPERRRHTTQWS